MGWGQYEGLDGDDETDEGIRIVEVSNVALYVYIHTHGAATRTGSPDGSVIIGINNISLTWEDLSLNIADSVFLLFDHNYSLGRLRGLRKSP